MFTQDKYKRAIYLYDSLLLNPTTLLGFEFNYEIAVYDPIRLYRWELFNRPFDLLPPL